MRILPVLLAYMLITVPAQVMAAEPAYDRVVASGTIRCAYGVSAPVMVKDPNTGAVSGLDVDIWTEIGKELGLKIEWAEEAGWGNFIEGLKTGRYDAFCAEVWPDPARTKFLSLTDPVLFTFADAYVRTDDNRFDGNLAKINDPSIKIPAIEGDVSVAMAQNGFPKATIEYLPQTASLGEMFQSVISKKSDLLLIEQSMIAALDANNKNAIRKVTGVPHVFTFASYYGVLAGEYQLRDMVNVALRTMKNDGRLEKLAKKYSDSYITPRPDFDGEK